MGSNFEIARDPGKLTLFATKATLGCAGCVGTEKAVAFFLATISRNACLLAL